MEPCDLVGSRVTINDRQIRKLPVEVRRELWTYIPRRTLQSMSVSDAQGVLVAYDRPDLASAIEEIGHDRRRSYARQDAHPPSER